jgi:hypothetical protein
MKEDTEIRWITNLLLSPYTSRLIGQKSASIQELERVAGSGENNKEFRKWFKTMFDLGCFKIHKKTQVNYFSKTITTYFVDKDNFFSHLNKIELFKRYYKIVLEDHYSL